METFEVPVEGGTLTVGRQGSGPVVLCAHGITANHTSWKPLADAIGDQVTIVAPDLRGRGASGTLPGPYNMSTHGRDLVAVLDHLGLDSAPVVGHSMGAFVAAVMAAEHPDRVERVLLVDGGLPLPVPEGLTVDQILTAVIGPAMTRLSMEFESREAYLDFWKPHPALGPWWDDNIQAYVEYDLALDGPPFRSRVSIDAVRGDAEDTLVSDTIQKALEALPRPTSILRAERGLMNEETPLVPDALAAAFPRVTDLGVVRDTNHYTIAFVSHGVKAIADWVL